ncbi:hypothetical protein RQP46_006547 [Phenoliferia psychrophenolica]
MGEPHEVIPGLFIGDYATSQNLPLLAKAGISNLVAAMRQDYDTPLTVHRVPVDDTSSTNIIAHFPATIHFIRDCRARNAGGVLVHCQAGVSRSTTLVAAFLMAELGLDVEQAVDKVRQVRSQVEPTEFFLHQLEMFERCECEWDPVKWIEQRRFLMGFAQAQIMDGTSPSIVLAYYPSPSPSPKSDPHSGGLTMTSLEQVSSTLLRTESGSSSSTIDVPTLVNGDSDGLGESATTTTTAAPLAPTDPPARKRLTAKGAGKVAETKPADPEKNSVENVGTKGQVVVVGKRIRCKMCRWMSPLLESGVLSGKIVCPGSKCGAKLGSFDWAGLQCSCGAWVLPGFALNVSRVDEYKPGVIAALA